MTMKEQRETTIALRRVADSHDSFPAEKAKLRSAMFHFFEQALPMSQWSTDDDRMFDLLQAWAVSVYDRLEGSAKKPAAAPAPWPESRFSRLTGGGINESPSG